MSIQFSYSLEQSLKKHKEPVHEGLKPFQCTNSLEGEALQLQLLQQWGALELLDSGLQRESDWQRRLRCAHWLGVNPLLGYIIAADKPLALASRLQLPIRQQRLQGKQHPDT